ncbi:MAG: hypothetical protein GOVbin630_37 [Prokaryotic dsDNA virus sp.]|nr:MAG: hypothetical protein GOVbin630_37 [Prokaryotic dsDNA virus sp.]|tara:strand:- start:30872 stop:31195 length:324 start_codon:yes stop_codon:yes gene_type:complete
MKERIIIDLEEAKLLQEGPTLRKFGAKVKQMLFSMFHAPGENFSTFFVKGRRPDVMAFGHVLATEKKYMDSYLKHGLNDPNVLQNRYRLDRAVQKFEQDTGIKWPFK